MSHRENHGIDDTTNHTGVSGATEDNLLAFDANGLPKDSGSAVTDFLVSGQESDSNIEINNSAASDTWTEINGVYFCPAGGNALEQLLLYMKNTTNKGGTILLAEGYHDITWTTSTPIDEAIHIIGPGYKMCTIRFTAGDADCRFYCTYTVIIEGVTLQASSGAANCLTFTGNNSLYSVVRNCYFSNLSNLTGSAIAMSTTTSCRVENCIFSDMNTTGRLFYISASSHCKITGCYSLNVRCTQLLYLIGSCTTFHFEDNYFVAGSTRQCCQIYVALTGPQYLIFKGNYIDFSYSPVSSAFNFIEFGAGSGNWQYGKYKICDNTFKCERSSSNWYAGANLMHVNISNIKIYDNIFQTKYIGYTNTQIGSIIHVERYGQNCSIKDNDFIDDSSRRGIFLECGTATYPNMCRIQGNHMRGLDHDGTGIGACIYVDDGPLGEGPHSTLMQNNYLGGSSNIYAIYAPGGGTVVAPPHAMIEDNMVAESALAIPVGSFEHGTVIGNNKEDSDAASGASISGTNTSNVYGDDGAGNPSTSAPGANQ